MAEGANNISIEKLYDKTNSIYKLVILASRRALELNVGAPRLTDINSDKPLLISLKEIAEGKVSFKLKDKKKKSS